MKKQNRNSQPQDPVSLAQDKFDECEQDYARGQYVFSDMEGLGHKSPGLKQLVLAAGKGDLEDGLAAIGRTQAEFKVLETAAWNHNAKARLNTAHTIAQSQFPPSITPNAITGHGTDTFPSLHQAIMNGGGYKAVGTTPEEVAFLNGLSQITDKSMQHQAYVTAPMALRVRPTQRGTRATMSASGYTQTGSVGAPAPLQ